MYEANHSFSRSSILLAFDVCFLEPLTLSQSRSGLLAPSHFLSRFIAITHSLLLAFLPVVAWIYTLITFCKLLPKRQTNPFEWQCAHIRQSSRNAAKGKTNRASNKMTKRKTEKEKLYRWQFWKGMKCFELNGRMKMETRDLAKMSLAIWQNKTTFSLWNLKIHFSETFQRANTQRMSMTCLSFSVDFPVWIGFDSHWLWYTKWSTQLNLHTQNTHA